MLEWRDFLKNISEKNVASVCSGMNYENTPIQMYRKLTSKNWKFSDKKLWYFQISAQHTEIGEAVLTSTTIIIFEQK